MGGAVQVGGPAAARPGDHLPRRSIRSRHWLRPVDGGGGSMSDTHNDLGSVTKFMPSVSSAEADKRYACWKIAVQRSLGLDALTH